MPIRQTVDFLRLNGDLMWAGAEYAGLFWADKRLYKVSPRPDFKKPVLSIPGFSGPEFTLAPMTRYLRKLGFDARTWGLGTNKGPRGGIIYMETLADQMAEKIHDMAKQSGAKVSLVGHSLGGIYARELARRFPDHIDRVITLGSPAHMDVLRSTRSINKLVQMAYDRMAGHESKDLVIQGSSAFHDMITPPPGIPLVAIYSPYDGVVTEDTTAIPPEYLHSAKGTPRENIEIITSHCGMVLNPLVLVTIADRLLEDPAKWQIFDPTKYMPQSLPILAKAFFPEPIHIGMQHPDDIKAKSGAKTANVRKLKTV